MAFAEVSSLIGFALVFRTGENETFYVGAAITALLFARAAPTKAHIARDQRELRRRGCDCDLIAALG